MRTPLLDPRQISYQVLQRSREKNIFCDEALKECLAESSLSDLDKKLATEITYGVLKNRLRIDYYIKQFSQHPFSRIDKETRTILRIGAYQLLFLDRVPDFAAVDEAVKLAKRIKGIRQSRFVNAVLREIIREQSKVELPSANDDFRKYLSVCYSHPRWLVDYLCATFGNTVAEDICACGNKTPPLTLRVNSLRISTKDMIAHLKQSGIENAIPGIYSPDAVYIERVGNLSDQSFIKEGLATIQDEASQLVGHILDPQPGEYIIDMCAAPGGKTTHIAQIQQDRGKILAVDISAERLAKVATSCEQLGITSVSIRDKTDANLLPLEPESADRILLDAPCSGLGTVRRRPDLRWKKTLKDIPLGARTQISLLIESADLLKPGGIIVYSVCTYTEEENERVVENFLALRSDFEIEFEVNLKVKTVKQFITESGFVKILPTSNDLDGFFVAKLKKQGT